MPDADAKGARVSSEDVPPELARLWRLPTTSRLGRPAALDIDQVVGTGVDLADRDGLAGATLPKIAERLGVTTMSLYRYVGSKDELLALMWDYAVGPPPEIEAPEIEAPEIEAPAIEERGVGERTDWRDGVRRWAIALREKYAAHGWMAHLQITGPPRGPNEIGWMDACLRALRPTGLSPAEKAGVLTLLAGQIRAASQQTLELAAARRATGLDQTAAERAYGQTMAGLVTRERFPDATELLTMLASTPTDAPTGREAEDGEFAFCLEIILDGIAATVSGRNQAG